MTGQFCRYATQDCACPSPCRHEGRCEARLEYEEMIARKPSQLQLYREWLEYAPRDPGPIAGDLAGWTDGLGYYICAHCAGRIMARGFTLQRPCTPTWGATDETCDLCGKSGA